jgi:hypothetical protein
VGGVPLTVRQQQELAFARERLRDLRASARVHKRAEQSHREKAKAKMAEAAVLVQQWAGVGVELTPAPDTDDSQSRRRQSDDSSEAASRGGAERVSAV